MKIRVAIMGYGNLGKGIECAIRQNEDMELVAVFTRRAPETVKTLTNVPVYAADKAPEMKDDIDVLMLIRYIGICRAGKNRNSSRI